MSATAAPTPASLPGDGWHLYGTSGGRFVIALRPGLTAGFIAATLVWFLEWILLARIARRWRIVARLTWWSRHGAGLTIASSLFAGLGIQLARLGPVAYLNGTWIRHSDLLDMVERHAPHPTERVTNLAVRCRDGRTHPVRVPRQVLTAFLSRTGAHA
jgi:hypothetical protein